MVHLCYRVIVSRGCVFWLSPVSGGQQFLDDRLIYEFRLDFNKPCILVDVLGVGVTDVKGQGDPGVMDVASLASGISSTSINSEDTPERLEKREIKHRWQDKQKEQQRSSNKAYLEEKERRKITFDGKILVLNIFGPPMITVLR